MTRQPQAPSETVPERTAFYDQLWRDNAKRYRTFDEGSVAVLYSILQAYNCCSARMGNLVAEHGLTLSALNILSILRQLGPGGCPLNSLSHLLLVSRANITGVVDHLVRKGLAKREAHANDRRVILAKITRKGTAWLDGYLPMHHARLREVFKGLADSEKAHLVRLLRKLRESTGSHPAMVPKGMKGVHA